MNMFSQCASFLQTDLKQRLSQRKLQFLVLGVAFLSFLPDFRASVIPRHDAREYLCAFQVFFSGLFHEGALPLWIPYGRYGTVSALLLMYITPFGFCVGVIGKLLGITDTLLLFKVGVLCEFLFYCFGMMKLSLLLFECYESVLLVSLGAIFSFSWMLSLDANLHTFYVLPFILRALTLFLSTGSMRQLWMTGVFCVISCIGNVPYHSPFLALLICAFSAVMLAQGTLKGKRLAFSFRDLVPMLIVVAGGVVYIGFYVVNLRGLDSFSIGRDPVTCKVTLEAFINFGGVTKLHQLAVEYLFGGHTQGDNTFYLGLAPLYLALYAFVQCKRRECLAFSLMALFLIAFSFGGPVAMLTYYFPGMSLYRHIALVFGQVKVFLLIAAGFGLNQMILNARAGQSNSLFAEFPSVFTLSTAIGRVRSLALVMIVSEGIISLFNAAGPWGYALLPYVDIFNPPLKLFCIRIAAYAFVIGLAVWLWRSLALRGAAKAALVANLFLLAYAMDIGTFKIASNSDWPLATPAETEAGRVTFQARKWQYFETRINPTLLLQDPEMQFLVFQGASPVIYSHVWSAAGLDPALPLYRTDFWNSDVVRLFGRRGVKLTISPIAEMLPETDLWLKNAIGYGAPKLRLIQESDLDEQHLEPDPPRAPLAPLGTIGKVDFSSNQVRTIADVTSETPVRLYYADAFHPGWRAYVNGNEVPITKTNVAFKSIPLQKGSNAIEFRFFDRWGSLFLYMLAVGSVGIMLYVAVYLLRETHLAEA